MFGRESIKPTSCCSLPTALRWMARVLNVFVALAFVSLIGRALEGTLALRYGLFFLLWISASVVWSASRLDTERRGQNSPT